MNLNVKNWVHFILIPYIGFGLMLLTIVGIEYTCIENGDGKLPTYVGNPFVFKGRSLATSMAWFQTNILAMVLNTIIWSVPFFLIRFLVLRFIQNRYLLILYRVIAGILVILATLIIRIHFDLTYHYKWFSTLEQEMTTFATLGCSGTWKFFPL